MADWRTYVSKLDTCIAEGFVGRVSTHFSAIPFPDRLLADTKRTAALLRLAVLLHRSHEAAQLPELRAGAKRDQLSIALPARWLDQRPLLRADLDGEPADMAGLGIQLAIQAD